MTEKKPENHCNHFVKRKKRYCRMTVIPGGDYCAEHRPPSALDPEDGKIRIVCPLDPKHTCYAHNLKKHLKICNARPGTPLPYIQKGINSGKTDNILEDLETYKLLSTFPTNEISEVISKVNKIYEDLLIGKITIKSASHQVVEEEMNKPEYGDKTKKHLKQASAIVGLLEEYNLIKTNTCYVEFGAGKGHLSYWLAQVDPNSSFLLIERASPKHKRDNKLDKTDDQVQRIRSDIADLILDKVDSVTKCSAIVGVTKHLCGEATDLALRCLSNVKDYEKKVSGCVMTFCCHHRCRWMPYTGKEFFQQVGLVKNHFDMMCGMSSWATCGTGFSRERNKETENGDEILNDRDKEIGLSRQQKEEVGKRCKAVLNWGRLKFLEQLGFECWLHFYVGTEVSLENVCIVACKKDENKK